MKWISILLVSILTGILLLGLSKLTENGIGWVIGMILLPLTIVMGSALFTIRGYELTPDYLVVQRLGWRTVINLRDLERAEINPEAMKRSIRLFGNGGLFSISGKFWNRRLGSYRALATNPDLAVILRFPHKVIVVTPDHPQKFVEALTDS